MVTVTARWTDWKFDNRGEQFQDKMIHPTPGRDRPLVVECSSWYTAGIIADILHRIGCTIEKEET